MMPYGPPSRLRSTCEPVSTPQTPSAHARAAPPCVRHCQLSWSELRLSPQHGLGYEQIPRHALRVSLPSHLTEDVQHLIAFRFAGNAPMVGYRVQAILYILWLDRDFTLYDHG